MSVVVSVMLLKESQKCKIIADWFEEDKQDNIVETNDKKQKLDRRKGLCNFASPVCLVINLCYKVNGQRRINIKEQEKITLF